MSRIGQDARPLLYRGPNPAVNPKASHAEDVAAAAQPAPGAPAIEGPQRLWNRRGAVARGRRVVHTWQGRRMAAAKLTAANLGDFHRLQKQRKNFERQARTLLKEESALAADLKTALEAAGQATAVRGGFRVSLIDGRPSVSWKEEFVKVAGAVKAVEVEKAAPVPKRIEVTEEPTAAAAANRKAA